MTKRLAVQKKLFLSPQKQRRFSRRYELNWPKPQALKLVLLAILT